MGIFSRKPAIIEAQNAPQVMSESYLTYGNYFPVMVTRAQALQVPSIKRCRDLICGTIASIPLEYYKKSTGEMIARHDGLSSLLKPSQDLRLFTLP
jgi:hypothetical protein